MAKNEEFTKPSDGGDAKTDDSVTAKDAIHPVSSIETIRAKYADKKAERGKGKKKSSAGRKSKEDIRKETIAEYKSDQQKAWYGTREALFIGYKGLLSYILTHYMQIPLVVSPEQEESVKINLENALSYYGEHIPEWARPLVGLTLVTGSVVQSSVESAQKERSKSKDDEE